MLVYQLEISGYNVWHRNKVLKCYNTETKEITYEDINKIEDRIDSMKLLADCQICGREFRAVFNESRVYRCGDCMLRLNALKDSLFVDSEINKDIKLQDEHPAPLTEG